MMDLANWEDVKLRKRTRISTEQDIPLEYMDQIILRLRKNNLVLAYRGPKGGLKLGKKSKQITLWDIFSTVEDDMYPVKCLDENKSCSLDADCMTKNVWSKIYDVLHKDLDRLTLEEVLIK